MSVHIHVGANVPGYLPESDVFCFDSVEGALDALKHELRDQQGYYYEQCMSECDRTHPYDECTCGSDCECAWCDVATDVEAALSAIADGDAAYVMRKGTGRLHIFRPPEGPEIVHWAMFADGDRDACEIYADQEDGERSCGCGATGIHGVDHED